MNTWKAKLFVVVLAGASLLWGCTGQALSETPASPSPTVAEATATPEEVATEEVSVTTAVPDQTLTPGMGGPGRGRGQGPAHAGQGPGGPPEGRGPDNPWRAFHQMPVPEEYASLTQPMPGDPASIERGAELYQSYCASCHGETGMGDGPAGASLTPPPSPLARTAPKLSDGYLYWRIAEGGLAFGTSMPSFGTALTEQDIWDIINFLRTMEAAEDPQAAQRLQEALQQAVEQGVITQEEADLFLQVHDLIEAYRQAHWEELRGQGSQQGSMIDLILQGLVDSGQIDEATAQRFRDVLQRLQDAQMLP